MQKNNNKKNPSVYVISTYIKIYALIIHSNGNKNDTVQINAYSNLLLNRFKYAKK